MDDNKRTLALVEDIRKTYKENPQVAFERVCEINNLEIVMSTYKDLEMLLSKLSGHLWMKGLIDDTFSLNKLLLKYYKSNDNSQSTITTLVRMSAAKIYFEDYIVANKLLSEAKELYDNSGMEDIGMLSGILINLGITYIHLNQMEKSYENLLTAKDICTQHNLNQQLLFIYINLIFYFNYIEDQTKMKETAEKGLILAQKMGNKDAEYSFKNSLGSVFKQEGKLELAMETFEECYDFLKNVEGGFDRKANALMNLGVIHLSLKNYDKSREFLKQALELSTKHDFFGVKFMTCINLIDLDIERDNLVDAENILNDIAKDIDDDTDWVVQLRFYNYKKWFLKLHNEYEKIYSVHEKMIELQEKINEQRFSKQIAQLEIELKVAQEKRENEILKEKNAELAEKNKKLVKAQEEIKELEMRNAVNAIAVTANHEINQPLAVISGVAELLQSRMINCDPEIDKYFEKLFDSIYKIKGILNKFSSHKKISIKEYAGLCKMISFDDEIE